MKAALPANTIQTKAAAKPAMPAMAGCVSSRSVEKTFKAIHAAACFTPSAALAAFKHVPVRK